MRKPSSRLLVPLAIFALLLPVARLAFHCQAMSEELRSVCCCTQEPAATCETGASCDTYVAGYQRSCCEVSLTPIRAVSALAYGAASDSASPKPPASGIPVSNFLALHASHAGAIERLSTPVDRSGRTIYLTTGRLRI